jgi:hypothetical protein
VLSAIVGSTTIDKEEKQCDENSTRHIQLCKAKVGLLFVLIMLSRSVDDWFL